jgi:DNA-directed RNA polymerase subunit beta
MGNYKVEKFGINTKRRNYQKTEKDLKVFDLLEIQTAGYQKFLDQGIEEVLQEIYPVKSTNDRITVEYIGHKLETPKNPEKAIREAKAAGTNYEGKVTAEFKLTNNNTGEVVREKSVYITKLPLMTPGGSFIINGSERIIISQIVRAPGAYFENMKAARSQSTADASVYKVASIIPNRGA